MKKILCGLMLLVSVSGFSQFNTIDFSMSFATKPILVDGLDGLFTGIHTQNGLGFLTLLV